MIDSANKNMLYSTRKWFLCLVHTLFKFVIRANSLVLPFLFIPGENSRQLQEWSQFRVCREHQAWPAIILAFYFVSEPIGFEKYILYRCRRKNHSHYSARQRLISHHAAIPPLTGAKAVGRNAGQNAGCRNAAVERMNRCQTQHQLHGNGGVRHDVGIAAVQHQGKRGRWSPLTEKGVYLCMTVNRTRTGGFPTVSWQNYCITTAVIWTPSAAARGSVCLTMAWPRRNGGHRNTENPGKAKPRPGILAKNIFASKYWHSNYIMLYCVSILKDESSL